jgi:periplasmic protein TonB
VSFAAGSLGAQRGLAGGQAVSLVASVALHVGIIAAFLALRPGPPPASPPIYRVNIVAAPPGAPAAGVVTPSAPAPAVDKPAPPRPKSEEVVPIPTKTPPRRVPRLATPNVSDTRVKRDQPAPVAGGGERGGRGTDVANIRTEGIDFPFPGYLENIVRQIALRFRPPRGSPLKAEVQFLIRRDGTISGFRFVQRSGSFTFDLEAQGAVESAATAFGPLPAGFQDDVLPVMFSFDPRLIR